MTEAQNNIYYTATLLEYVARQTKNKRDVIAELVGEKGVRDIYNFAGVSHCLPMAQVADEVVQDYNIPEGEFSPEAAATRVPSATDIGKVYMRLVEDAQPNPQKYPEELFAILKSKISEWMVEYQSAFFYSPRDYVLDSYRSL